MFCWPLLLRGAIRQDLIWNYPSYAKHPRIFSSLLPLNCEILLRNQQPAYTAPSSTRLDRREGIRAWDGNHACTPIILYFNKVPILSSRQNYGLGILSPFPPRVVRPTSPRTKHFRSENCGIEPLVRLRSWDKKLGLFSEQKKIYCEW